MRPHRQHRNCAIAVRDRKVPHAAKRYPADLRLQKRRLRTCSGRARGGGLRRLAAPSRLLLRRSGLEFPFAATMRVDLSAVHSLQCAVPQSQHLGISYSSHQGAPFARCKHSAWGRTAKPRCGCRICARSLCRWTARRSSRRDARPCRWRCHRPRPAAWSASASAPADTAVCVIASPCVSGCCHDARRVSRSLALVCQARESNAEQLQARLDLDRHTLAMTAHARPARAGRELRGHANLYQAPVRALCRCRGHKLARPAVRQRRYGAVRR